MIKAVIFKNQDNICGFKITGHAGFAEFGKDIVCAAVSILAITTVNSLEEQLSVKPKYNVDEDQGFLECLVNEGLSEQDFLKAQVILKTLEIGLKSIEQNYNGYLQITQRRWTEC